MARIIQKFGGSSIATCDLIKKAAQIAINAAKDGDEVATVVSAMADITDQLLTLANQISAKANPRELDMLLSIGEQQSAALLSMAIQELGYPSRSFTGMQAGIITDCRWGTASIQEVNCEAVEASLARGEIPVVTGFQGITTNQEVTTLGRGGSDTTAVALANALSAERCDIYTDVSGVFTADPAIVNEALRLPCLSYEEMLEMSATGAQVIHYQAAELAMANHIPVRIRSTFLPHDPGTLITHRFVAPEYPICGVTSDTNQSCFNLKFPRAEGELKPLDSISSLFTRLNELGIVTDMIIILDREDEPLHELSFTVNKQFAQKVESVVQSIWSNRGPLTLSINNTMARISVVSRTMTARPEIVASVFETLNQADITVAMVTTSDLRMSILLPIERAYDSVKLIHDHFNMADGLKAA